MFPVLFHAKCLGARSFERPDGYRLLEAVDFLSKVPPAFREEAARGKTIFPPGFKILVVHGSPDGTLHFPPEVQDFDFDALTCCHPAAAQRAHPGLPILGDWEGQSEILGPRASGEEGMVNLHQAPSWPEVGMEEYFRAVEEGKDTDVFFQATE